MFFLMVISFLDLLLLFFGASSTSSSWASSSSSFAFCDWTSYKHIKKKVNYEIKNGKMDCYIYLIGRFSV